MTKKSEVRDAVATMGGILPADVGGRDAVHVAVFSAISEERLYPGDEVGIVRQFNEKDFEVSNNFSHCEFIGIVDPFISKRVAAGERFWVYLYPRTITALSHQWQHPAFEKMEKETKEAKENEVKSAKEKSEAWLRNFCETHNVPSYESTLQTVQDAVRNDELRYGHITVYGQDAHCDLPNEFWQHMEVVLGVEIQHRPEYFSCSC